MMSTTNSGSLLRNSVGSSYSPDRQAHTQMNFEMTPFAARSSVQRDSIYQQTIELESQVGLKPEKVNSVRASTVGKLARVDVNQGGSVMISETEGLSSIPNSNKRLEIAQASKSRNDGKHEKHLMTISTAFPSNYIQGKVVPVTAREDAVSLTPMGHTHNKNDTETFWHRRVPSNTF